MRLNRALHIVLGAGEIIKGICPAAVYIDLKMEMWTGGNAGGAHKADDLPLAYLCSGGHEKLAHVSVQGGGSVAVVDDYLVAVRGIV